MCADFDTKKGQNAARIKRLVAVVAIPGAYRLWLFQIVLW